MALTQGTKLGPYEITVPLGAGGMGEVYRARDTRLKRDVAIKVLPDTFSQDPERIARFQREAEVLASLNHPGIAAIYGLEESDGVRALVLELVEGPTLADRISQAAIPIEEALPIAKQIAEALEAAHEQGIIHRDLKPANIKVTPEGVVKVLDFGLAKALEPEQSDADAANSPTMTAAATKMGVLMGTAAYMSPEQARGETVDRRADIWAFGAVLYEMVAGRRVFEGATVSDTLASALKTEPDWTVLPADTPAPIRRLLRRCLEKDRKRRLGYIGDARLEIEDALAMPGADTLEAVDRLKPATAHRGWRAWIAAMVGVGAVSGLVVWALVRDQSLAPGEPVRFRMDVGSVVPFAQMYGNPAIAVSPDGGSVVFVDMDMSSTSTQLMLRSLDRLEATPVVGTEGGVHPFFSPDGQWIGFLNGTALKKVPLGGGVPVTICDVPQLSGAVWLPDDTIVFAPNRVGGLLRVSAVGGTPEEVTTLDATRGERSHRWPSVLPDGATLLFTVTTGGAQTGAHVAVMEPGAAEHRVILEGGSDPRYAETGHLVFVRDRRLMAVPLDVSRLATRGAPVLVAEGTISDIGTGTGAGSAQYGFGRNGTLVYFATDQGLDTSRLAWVSREGREDVLPLEPLPYRQPRLSPDGRRVALAVRGAPASDLPAAALNTDIWGYDLERRSLTRLTFDLGEDETPLWTPDGRALTYAGTRGPRRVTLQRPADGGGDEEVLLSEVDFHHHLSAWSPDGTTLVWTEVGQTSAADYHLWIADPGRAEPRQWLTPSLGEQSLVFSPDGKWTAYASVESGESEIYVRSFPEAGGKWQVSTNGGSEPFWSADGREIFYRSGDRMMAVSVNTEPRFSAEPPTGLFAGRYERLAWNGRNYDVTADGQRFLMLKSEHTVNAQLHVVLKWFDELKARVPTGQ